MGKERKTGRRDEAQSVQSEAANPRDRPSTTPLGLRATRLNEPDRGVVQ